MCKYLLDLNLTDAALSEVVKSALQRGDDLVNARLGCEGTVCIPHFSITRLFWNGLMKGLVSCHWLTQARRH